MSVYKAFEGANGWYVSYEDDDGFHRQPAHYRGMEQEHAEAEAVARNQAEEDEL